MNVIARLKFKLAYYDSAVQRLNHYITGTLPPVKEGNNEQNKKLIKAVFQNIDEYSFKLGSEKCEFFMKQIKYLGQIIDENGRRLNPERVEAIENVPSPNNVSNLPSLLGLAIYHIIYIPKTYDLRAPLNDLLKKGAKWIWSKECKDDFQKIKRYLLSELSLAHFDPKKR